MYYPMAYKRYFGTSLSFMPVALTDCNFITDPELLQQLVIHLIRCFNGK